MAKPAGLQPAAGPHPLLTDGGDVGSRTPSAQLAKLAAHHALTPILDGSGGTSSLSALSLGRQTQDRKMVVALGVEPRLDGLSSHCLCLLG